jgi:Effector-associated domain 1
MSSFSGTERGLLSDAVLAAFPQNRGLRQWLDRKLNTQKTKDDNNIIQCVNLDNAPSEVAFELVQWLESRGRIVEFLAKIAPDYPNRAVLNALRESLACTENESEARLRFREFLEILADQPLNEVVIRFIQEIPGCPDPLPEPLRLTVDRERVAIADVSPTSENDFDRHTAEVAKTIRSKLDTVKDTKVLDENDQEVWLLTLVSQELDAGGPSSGKDLSEYLATFLTERRDIEHIGLLVSRVFDLLRKRGKKAEAQIIENVVDLMLPLCIPRDILSEAWVQLKDHGAVLIRSSVARKAGAEILVAGLFKKSTRWATSSSEPTGEQLVGFEAVPIGDPDQSVDSALHDLFVATFYPTDKRKPTSLNASLTAALMRADLSGHYRSSRIGPQRPCYCAVELAACEADRENQRQIISNLAIPDLLFIELKPDSKTRELESFVIHCLNTRLGSVAKGFPE